MADYYDILGIEKTAGKDEIKSAFRAKARKFHPDVNKAADAEDRFKELGKAYETLMDDQKRALYDQYGEDGLSNAGYGGGGPFEGGFGDLNDIINSFFSGFGGFSHQEDPNAPQSGDDLRADIQLEFEQAVFGIDKELEISHLETCAKCSGSGAKAGSKPTTCPTCKGQGRVQQMTRTVLGSFSQVTTCPDCKGKGIKINDPCPDCSGHGRIEKDKTVSFKIPAGVDNGSKIRLSGEGDAGKNNGPSGDLYIVLHVKQSDYFKRQGVDVYTELEISPAQAVLGDDVEIKTLDDMKQVNIPAGIQSGNSIRLKSSGVPFISRPSQRGDHIVVVTVKTPTSLNDEEKDLYKKLYELNTNKTVKSGLKDKILSAFN